MRWRGVFPVATTQFRPDLSVDLDATQGNLDALIRDGVHGLVLLGTCGENNSLEPEEKRRVLAAACDADAEAIGADALMVLPAMVYVPKEHELAAHFRTVATATNLPIMLYNNPPAYRVNITLPVLRSLADCANIVAIKESAPDTRRFTDLANAFGDRFVLMAGLDDVALEGLMLGAEGWISGLTSAFPRESVALYEAAARGDLARALRIYRWFMPLLHLDAEHDLVQSIKLAEQIMGRGAERVRPPRLPLEGARRAEVTAMVEAAAATRPVV